MAYAALVSAAQTMEQILLQDRFPAPLHIKEQINSLHEPIVSLIDFLDDFQDKATNLEGRIRDFANEAEAVVEDFLLQQVRDHHSKSAAGPENIGEIGGRITRGFSDTCHEYMSWFTSKLRMNCGHNPDFQDLSQKLGTVTKEIHSVVEEAIEIKNRVFNPPIDVDNNDDDVSSSRLEAIDKNVMVGFDEDLVAIKAQLCGESSKLEVIPIFGMGGIGKTTLARNACDDPLTVERFDVRCWVTVSQDYVLKEICRSLLVSVKAWDDELRKEKYEKWVLRTYQSLKGRRYLIVLDDMWTTNCWDELKKMFPDDENGSRIILTTRLADVAAYAVSCSSSNIHEVPFMDGNMSWDLLRERVFAENDHTCPSELESLGKKIAISCSGLPLAIVVAAGLLSTVGPTQASWQSVADNISSIVTGANDDQLQRILSLSYKLLPHHLRMCFLYMGAFPEDYEIRASQLTKLWVAEGFLKLPPSSVCKSVEDRAEEHLEDLVKRSLVLVKERKPTGKIKTCGLHDLLRDLCVKKAHEEKFLLHSPERNVLPHTTLKSERRLSFFQCRSGFATNLSVSLIHTILYFHRGVELLYFLENSRVLRVLNAMEVQLLVFPPEVVELFNLRYLALTISEDAIDSDNCIPEDIVKLEKLQALVVQPRVTLPSNIWRMTQLRHIVSRNIVISLPSSPGQDFRLENLRTLWKLRNACCSKRLLDIFPNVMKLGLIYDSSTECYLENLVHLHHLENLKVVVESIIPRQLFAELAFPETLKKLSLGGCRFRWQDMSLVGLLPNLEVLKLRHHACIGPAWETNVEGFPRLKLLLIDETDLELWTTESSHFPSLKGLILYHCQKLREIPLDVGEIPTLELIEVDNSNKCVVNSAKLIREEQEDMGNDTLQVRIIRSMFIARS